MYEMSCARTRILCGKRESTEHDWVFEQLNIFCLFFVSEMPRQNSRSGTLSIFFVYWFLSFFSISSYRLEWKTDFENFSRCHSKRGLIGTAWWVACYLHQV